MGDLETRWEISKTMEQLNNNYKVYKGHQKMPLFNMIPLDHWLIDELHVMLRITDRLWKLVLDELREIDLFDDLSRNVIVKEMCRIKVKFQFWKDKETGIWGHSSLMGEDKMKVLRKFNLELLFSPSRATKIRKLWDKFSDLYDDLRNNDTDPNDFEKSAKEWLALFLLPSRGNWLIGEEIISGLYLPSEITPYIHVLVHHVADMMRKHRNWGLKSFSCSAVEKKNHQQVSYFFRKTLKDGGKCKDGRSSIKELLYHENRTLHFMYNNNLSHSLPKSQKIHIQ